MESDIVNKVIKETPLKTRLRVSTEMAFINLLNKLGFREDKMWTDDEDEMLEIICSLAEDLADDHIKEFEEWQKDNKF